MKINHSPSNKYFFQSDLPVANSPLANRKGNSLLTEIVNQINNQPAAVFTPSRKDKLLADIYKNPVSQISETSETENAPKKYSLATAYERSDQLARMYPPDLDSQRQHFSEPISDEIWNQMSSLFNDVGTMHTMSDATQAERAAQRSISMQMAAELAQTHLSTKDAERFMRYMQMNHDNDVKWENGYIFNPVSLGELGRWAGSWDNPVQSGGHNPHAFILSIMNDEEWAHYLHLLDLNADRDGTRKTEAANAIVQLASMSDDERDNYFQLHLYRERKFYEKISFTPMLNSLLDPFSLMSDEERKPFEHLLYLSASMSDDEREHEALRFIYYTMSDNTLFADVMYHKYAGKNGEERLKWVEEVEAKGRKFLDEITPLDETRPHENNDKLTLDLRYLSAFQQGNITKHLLENFIAPDPAKENKAD